MSDARTHAHEVMKLATKRRVLCNLDPGGGGVKSLMSDPY